MCSALNAFHQRSKNIMSCTRVDFPTWLEPFTARDCGLKLEQDPPTSAAILARIRPSPLQPAAVPTHLLDDSEHAIGRFCTLLLALHKNVEQRHAGVAYISEPLALQ